MKRKIFWQRSIRYRIRAGPGYDRFLYNTLYGACGRSIRFITRGIISCSDIMK